MKFGEMLVEEGSVELQEEEMGDEEVEEKPVMIWTFRLWSSF